MAQERAHQQPCRTVRYTQHHKMSNNAGSNDTESQKTSRTDKNETSTIVKLLDACKKHKALHSEGKITPVENNRQKPPTRCRKDLRGLQTVLPSVESEFKKASSVENVKYLCEFYKSVVNNGFCPHANLTFSNSSENLLRVVQLLRHLTFTPDGYKYVKDVCGTIAQIVVRRGVSEGDGDKLRKCLVRDFIILLQDLTVLRRIVSTSQQNYGHDNAVIIFEEARSYILLQKAEESDDFSKSTSAPGNDKSEANSFSRSIEIKIPTPSSIRALQKGCFEILCQILDSNQINLAAKRMLLADVCGDGNGSSAMRSAMFASIFSLLLWKDHEHTISILDIAPSFSEKNAAASLLLTLVRTGFIRGDDSMVATRICQVILQHVQRADNTSTKEMEEFSDFLCQLLHEIILVPFHLTSARYMSSLRAVMLILLDCLPYIATRTRSGQSVHAGRTLLKCIYCCLKYVNDDIDVTIEMVVDKIGGNLIQINRARAHCNSKGIFVHLMSLLREFPFCSFVTDILSLLVNATVFDRACLSLSHQGGGFLPQDQVVASNGENDDADSSSTDTKKRKRSAIQSSLGGSSSKAATSAKDPSVEVGDGNSKRIKKPSAESARAVVDNDEPGNTNTLPLQDDSLDASLFRLVDSAVNVAGRIMSTYNEGGLASVLSNITSPDCIEISSVMRVIFACSKVSPLPSKRNVSAPLVRSMELIAQAIVHGCMLPADSQIVGPRRLKKLLGSVVSFGFAAYLHQESDALDDPTLCKVAECAAASWRSGSLLLEGPNSSFSSSLDPLDAALEDEGKYKTRDFCSGKDCVSLSKIFGSKRSNKKGCFCRYGLDNNLVNTSEFLPLNTRCVLLACLCPVTRNSTTFEKKEAMTGNMSTILSLIEGPPNFVTPSAIGSIAILAHSIMISLQENSDLVRQIITDEVLSKLQHHLVTFISHDAHACRRSAFICATALVEIAVAIANNTDVECCGKDREVVPFLQRYVNRFGSREMSVSPPLLSGDDMKVSGGYAFALPVLNSISSKDDCSHVRLERWKMLANIVRLSSPRELRKSKAHLLLAPTSNKGEPIELDSDEDSSMENPFVWLFRIPFVDPDNVLRQSVAQSFGTLLLGKESSFLFSMFLGNEKDWRKFEKHGPRDVTEVMVASLFREIEKLLVDYCSFNPTQLSFTGSYSKGEGSNSDPTAAGPKHISRGRSALRCLSSLCEKSSLSTNYGVMIYERSLLQLIRVWVSGGIGSWSHTRFLAHSELCRLHRLRPFHDVLDAETSILAHIFTELTTKSVLETTPEEEEFYFTAIFVRSFLLPDESSDQSYSAALNNFESILADLLAHFIIEEMYDNLLLCAGFRMFLREKVGTEKSGEVRVVGKKNQSKSRQILNKKRKEELSRMCLDRELLPDIFPQLLLRGSRSCQVFLLKTVLAEQENITLTNLIKCRDLTVLKHLIVELASDLKELSPENTNESESYLSSQGENIERNVKALTPFLRKTQTLNALKKGGLIRLYDDPKRKKRKGRGGKRSSGSELSLSASNALAGIDAMEANVNKSAGVEAAAKWISRNFMFLLVNVVLDKWNTSNCEEKVRAMRCLFVLLHFIDPHAAPQYIPQVMSAVNVAMNVSKNDYERLRLLAVRSLSKFVDGLMIHNVMTVGSNLSSIVVSLFPVLHEYESDVMGQVATTEAAALLERLVSNEELLPFFQFVPFLPDHPLLEKVKQVLKTGGVYIDSLSQSAAKRSTSPQNQAALQRRLVTLCKMMRHESVSVRRVVITHIADLLRVERPAFQNLLEAEQAASMRFLTVINTSKMVDSDYSNDALSTVMQDLTPGSGGGVTFLMHSLLLRCAHEQDPECRIALALCLGEVGAIDPNLLGGDIDSGSHSDQICDNHEAWRLSQPPWKSQIHRYELALVTKHLVVALKAAPTTQDQHKIAFAIQEVLASLESHAKFNASSMDNSDDDDDDSDQHSPLGKSEKKLSMWLKNQLQQAGVLEVIEPFSVTNYKHQNIVSSKPPPFFRTASSYYVWLASWCRHMIERSNENERSRWKTLFQSCRSAIRSPSGTSVAEFLLPVLVLGSICFGDTDDEKTVVEEMRDVLSSCFSSDANSHTIHQQKAANINLDNDERQKAVNAIFMIIDTLQNWADKETEERHRSSKKLSSSKERSPNKSANQTIELNWPLDESIICIAELLDKLDLCLLARAASYVGMHARSLRYIEMEARRRIVEDVFDDNVETDASMKDNENRGPGGSIAPLRGIDLGLVQTLLGQLNDFDALTTVAREYSRLGGRDLIDQVREREVQGDWSGALQGYEQMLQMRRVNHNGANKTQAEKHSLQLQSGLLRSLLELGQLESVLNQVGGIFSQSENNQNVYNQLAPSAAEAAWRLGRWSLLEDLVKETDSPSLDEDGRYQLSIGKTMLGLHKCSEADATSALMEARTTAMTSLSNVSKDSYTRAYPHLLKLHALREIECAIPILCTRITKETCEGLSDRETDIVASFRESIVDNSNRSDGWSKRIELASPEVVGSSIILNTRLALSRFANAPEVVGETWLTIGKRARKQCLFHIAETALAHAAVAVSSLPEKDRQKVASIDHEIQMQLAKVKHATGESSTALMMLERDDSEVRKLLSLDETKFKKQISPGIVREFTVEMFAKRVLKATEWMAESGLKGGSEVIHRFQLVIRLRPEWEKSNFALARYLDSMLEARISAGIGQFRARGEGDDVDAMREKALAMDTTCHRYLLDAMQAYSQALLHGDKHLFQALPRMLTIWFDLTSIDESTLDREDLQAILLRSQEQANTQMRNYMKAISSYSFYSALPQLISRVSHQNHDTATIVKKILTRVLSRLSPQAMWPLAWLQNSTNGSRAEIGSDIFKSAMKHHAQQQNMKMHDLLNDSKGLFKFLIELAKYNPKKSSTRTFSVKPWRGTGSAQLIDFVPPIQAALGISRASSHRRGALQNGSGDRDYFPEFIPRMRSLSSQVEVMNSKARPKKITAYAVAPGQTLPILSKSAESRLQPGDAGEMHFLVKQEAKGDLRKDARVQDLNSVINRLLGASRSGSHGRQRRRLQLRTFSVVCLSEDCGILEWVPNTDSLRSVVSISYNPQADAHSIRRRGKRMTNFGDVSLRNNFQKCQDMYTKHGNLVKAGLMFEEECLKPYPPLLYWWFVQSFSDPHAWFEARTKFALSAAAWSAVGHVIGLGDRHSENILVDTSSGECVHVDFDCIFDKGLTLPRPEVIPFRLTQNMVDAFGPTGYEGTYRGGLTSAMTTLREHRETLLSVLEPFLKDPVINWKRQRSQQKQGSKSTSGGGSVEAKRSVKVIDGRLRGIYNLRNPNMKKIPRTDGVVDQEDEMSNILPLSVEGQVHRMISEATSHENLVQLYVGWMPWI